MCSVVKSVVAQCSISVSRLYKWRWNDVSRSEWGSLGTSGPECVRCSGAFKWASVFTRDLLFVYSLFMVLLEEILLLQVLKLLKENLHYYCEKEGLNTGRLHPMTAFVTFVWYILRSSANSWLSKTLLCWFDILKKPTLVGLNCSSTWRNGLHILPPTGPQLPFLPNTHTHTRTITCRTVSFKVRN